VKIILTDLEAAGVKRANRRTMMRRMYVFLMMRNMGVSIHMKK